MRLSKRARCILAGVAAVALLAGLAAWLLSLATPGGYSPPRLSPAQRRDASREFYRGVLDGLLNPVQEGRPFGWTVTQRELNAWIASADEVARRYGGGPNEATRAMARAGMADPFVAMQDGRLTLMARAVEQDRIVSVELAFDVDERGRLAARVAGARVGWLPLPRSAVHDRLAAARADMLQRLKEAEDTEDPLPPMPGQLSIERLAAGAQVVVQALEGRPVPTEFKWFHHRARLAGIEITDGQMVLRFEPVKEPDRPAK